MVALQTLSHLDLGCSSCRWLLSAPQRSLAAAPPLLPLPLPPLLVHCLARRPQSCCGQYVAAAVGRRRVWVSKGGSTQPLAQGKGGSCWARFPS